MSNPKKQFKSQVCPDTNLDQKYLDRIENIEFNPIFILGLHRSGTSILYKMISSTDHFNTVTAYHLLCYNSLLHNHINELEDKTKQKLTSFLQQKQKDRVIDKLKVTADFTEEYGFLLNKKQPQGINNHNLALFKELCKKILYIGNQNNPILLKNPWDFSNFMYIKEKLPQAKFIFIHRHPVRTANSSMRALRSLLYKQSIYSDLLSDLSKRITENPLASTVGKALLLEHIPIGLLILVERFVNETNYFLNNISHLSKNTDYTELRYEDLCSEPVKCMEKILDFLDIEDVKNIDRFNDFIKPRNLNLSTDVEAMKKYIQKRLSTYLSYCEYPPSQ